MMTVLELKADSESGEFEESSESSALRSLTSAVLAISRCAYCEQIESFREDVNGFCLELTANNSEIKGALSHPSKD